MLIPKGSVISTWNVEGMTDTQLKDLAVFYQKLHETFEMYGSEHIIKELQLFIALRSALKCELNERGIE